MADVYQATDTKLGRSVAIKFLPEAFSHDTERLRTLQKVYLGTAVRRERARGMKPASHITSFHSCVTRH